MVKVRSWGLLLVCVAACSSSESPANAPATDGGAEAAAAGTPFTVWVYSPRVGADATEQPIGGATVAIDPAGGGERIEATTEPDGHVTIDVDFGKGPATVTAVAPDHGLLTILEASPEILSALPANPFGKPTTDAVLVLPVNGKGKIARTVELTGSLSGKTATAHVIGMGATGAFDSYQFPGDMYAARVPKDRAFSLLCFEALPDDDPDPRAINIPFLRAFRVDRPATATNATLDIDVSQGTVATAPLKWKIEVTGGDSGPLGGTSFAFANVASFDSGAGTGFFKRIMPTADKSAFDVEIELAQTDLAPEVTRSVAVLRTSDGATSIRQEIGVSPEGTVFGDFLTPTPVVVTKQKRTDPIVLDGFPEGAWLSIQMRTGQDTEWVVLGAYQKPPTGPVTLPAPPSGAQLPASMNAQIVALADDVDVPGRPGARIPRKIAVSRPFAVTR